MAIGDWIQIFAGAATILLLILAGISDIRRYRIPNAIVGAVVLVFAVSAITGFSWPAIGWSLVAGAAMFLLGAGLFALGLFGGGDVKLIAAMALWTGIADLARFLLVMTATGGVLGVLWLIKRRRQGSPLVRGDAEVSTATGDGASSAEVAATGATANRIPYAVAIAAAGVDFFLASVHSPFAPLWPWMP